MLIFFLLTGLSFKTESRIEFLTSGTRGTKVLGNIPDEPCLIYSDKYSKFEQLLENDNSVTTPTMNSSTVWSE